MLVNLMNFAFVFGNSENGIGEIRFELAVWEWKI